MRKTIMLTFLFFCALAVSAQANYQWHDPQQAAFQVVSGQAFPKECRGNYHRFADRHQASLPGWVWGNSLHSAGLTLRFNTAAPEITVRYTTGSRSYAMPHMPATGVSGIDLYATDDNGHAMLCHGNYSFRDTVTYTYNNLVYRHAAEGVGYNYELFFPLYNSVNWMEIGVPAGCDFRFLEAETDKPILVYGTSIAHGGCASRPAMAWTGILHRRLELPVINWGFSGSGRLDEEVFTLMKKVDARLFVIDCMPNMTPTNLCSEIVTRMVKGVKMLREVTNAPILIVEHDGYTCEETNDVMRDEYLRANAECRKAFEQLRSEGVKGVYYLSHKEIGMDADGMVDNVHSTDFGMMIYADAYERKIRKILHLGKASRR